MCGTLSHSTLLQCNSNQALAALPVMQVSVQWLFPTMSQLLWDLQSPLMQDAIKAMLLLRTNMI